MTIHEWGSRLPLISKPFILCSAVSVVILLASAEIARAQEPPRLSPRDAEDYDRNMSLIASLQKGIVRHNASIERLINQVIALKKALSTQNRVFAPEYFDPPLFPPSAELSRTIEGQRQVIAMLSTTLESRLAIERRLKQRRDQLRQELRRADRDARASK